MRQTAMTTSIKERPIDLTADEVRAALEGRLTEIRRDVEPQPERSGDGWLYDGQFFGDDDSMQSHLFHDVYGEHGTPYGSVYGDGSADRLWVREAFYHCNGKWQQVNKDWIRYKATDEQPEDWPLRPSIHMPKWASRLTLELADVDVALLTRWQWLITVKVIEAKEEQGGEQFK